jgi:hypothetical protein
MSTHFGFQIPSNLNNWIFFNGYYDEIEKNYNRNIITSELVKKIYESGITKVHLSIGSRFAEEQENYQKNKDFQESLLSLNNISFEVVIIDDLNPPHASIMELFPAKYYLIGYKIRPINSYLYNSWKDKAINPKFCQNDHPAIKIFNEIYLGSNCSYKNYHIMRKNCWKKFNGIKQESYEKRKKKNEDCSIM